MMKYKYCDYYCDNLDSYHCDDDGDDDEYDYTSLSVGFFAYVLQLSPPVATTSYCTSTSRMASLTSRVTTPWLISTGMGQWR